MSDKPYLLIADDEPMNQLIYEELFAEDFEITLVDNGLACMDSLAERIPDALVLDVSMPGMTGFEVCEKVRGDDQFPYFPILLVSGYASQADKEKGMALGADDYIAKPFPIFEFKQMMDRLVRKDGD